jgi:hypothetical protein
MAQLTHADKGAFIASVSTGLKTNAAAFAGKDFDPVARAAVLDAATANINTKAGVRIAAETALTAAVADENKAIDDGYNLASTAVGGVSGTLTEKHPLTQQFRKMRGSLHHASPAAAPAAAAVAK